MNRQDPLEGAQARDFPVNDRTRVRRRAVRGRYDRETIFAIIDEAMLCHVAFHSAGEPRVLPTAHARIGERLYVHGAVGNHMLRSMIGGRVAVGFTLLDGLVFARTAFHHSMNYRSAVVFGSPAEVTDEVEKRAALHALIERTAPGRVAELPPITEAELAATHVVSMEIEEASAKVRMGPPVDDAHTLDLPIWAGVVPLRSTACPPVRDGQLDLEQPLSRAVADCCEMLGAEVPYETRRGDLLLSTDRSLLDFECVHDFLANQSYWARDITAERLRVAMTGSLCFGVYRRRERSDATQIGFARVVTDGARFAWLADVFVLATDRGQGIGSWLITNILAHPQLRTVERWQLGTQGAESFYARFGWRVAAGDALPNTLMVRGRVSRG